jgi:hypothetical protein
METPDELDLECIAVMVCVPVVSVVTGSVAAPLPFKDSVDRSTPPSKKLTEPVGVPLAEELTVAVKVTDPP